MQSLGLILEKKGFEVLKNFIFLFVVLFLTSCSLKHEINFSAPYKIVIKTKDIAIGDSGFIKKADGYKSIEIFSAGFLALHVELGANACINGMCTDRLDFNRRFFGYSHYANLLDDILDKKEIYSGMGKIKLKDGFEQNIKTKHYNITYRVTKNSIYFKDKTNHILIKLKEITK